MSETDSQRTAEILLEIVPKVNSLLRSLVFGRTQQSLSIPLYRVLTVLTDAGPLPMSILARHEGVKGPTMSRFIDSLAQKKLVQRGASPADRRIILVRLTAKGVETVASVRREVVRELSSLLEPWPAGDLSLVEAALVLLRQHQLYPGRFS
ncbi:MAG: MarR family transcriptional regulator [Spirochaetales bacterium]|nr:MarR family transcriptional regulator [Spirochaetales bacterium]